jgi:hypothetical protein
VRAQSQPCDFALKLDPSEQIARIERIERIEDIGLMALILTIGLIR